jgi:hypothetical protein
MVNQWPQPGASPAVKIPPHQEFGLLWRRFLDSWLNVGGKRVRLGPFWLAFLRCFLEPAIDAGSAAE